MNLSIYRKTRDLVDTKNHLKLEAKKALTRKDRHLPKINSVFRLFFPNVKVFLIYLKCFLIFNFILFN